MVKTLLEIGFSSQQKTSLALIYVALAKPLSCNI